MNIKLQLPTMTHLRPRITVVGVGGAGSNAVNNMIASGLSGVNFCVANTDSQSLANSAAEQHIQLGAKLTEGLGAGAKPEIGRASAEEAIEEIRAKVAGSHMVFVAAGMGGGTGTGAAAVIARIARESGALTVGVVTKPFHFEGSRRMRAAESGIAALKPEVDTLIVIPNQNLFRIANERTTFAEAFVLADQVLYSGIACVVDLIVKEGLINLDFADVRTIMSGMGTAMMGTGEASGERRAVVAAEEAISNPLLDDISLRGARGLLVSITGSRDLKLYEVDEAAQRVRQEVDAEANIIVGATFDDTLGDRIRVSIVASGMERLGENAQSWDQQAAPIAQSVVANAIPSNQPPFIEPYPEPNALPPTPPQTYPNPAHASAMSRDIRSQPDFARALSEALDSYPAPTHHDNPPQFPPPQPTWSSANGAVFTDAPPALGRESLNDGLSSINRPPEHQPGFHPQPPAEARALGRRLPEVTDFPPLAQREYHAKSREYGEAAIPPPPRALTQPAQPKVKRGLFARLFGRKPRHKVTEPSPTYQQGTDPRQHSADALRQSSRAQVDANPRAPRRAEEETYELPAFFGSKRN